MFNGQLKEHANYYLMNFKRFAGITEFISQVSKPSKRILTGGLIVQQVDRL